MPMFQVGDAVERNIEDMWFSAIIEGVNLTRRQLKIRFLDDDNVEEGVPMADCRPRNVEVYEGESKGNYETRRHDCKRGEDRDGKSGVSVGKKDTLKKPLAGLIEDDCKQRAQSVPVVVLHSTADTEDAIILHGEESRMAAGGGLRALRFLKDRT